MNNDRCHAPGECYCDRCCLRIVNDNLCNYISKASLPKLPEGWSGPWKVQQIDIRKDGYAVFGAESPYNVFCAEMVKDEATFLVALLNACYPANGTP